jgi:multiple sugar transport system permease protein
MTRGERRNLRNGLLFASPYLIGLFCFTLYPLCMSAYYSMCEYTVISPPHWVGFANYTDLFRDGRFWDALGNTLVYTAVAVPVGLAIAVGLAVLLNQRLRGMSVYRTIFFLPSIVPIVASAILWLWVLNPETGLINGTLMAFHVDDFINWVLVQFGRQPTFELPGWLTSETWSKPALMLMSFWGIGGAMVIFLAGLTDVPDVLYEVADLDGAGPFLKFRHVTLPMLTPTILFNLVIGLIDSFQYFTQAYIMTSNTNSNGTPGGPMDSTLFYALYMYMNSFLYLRMGYASAMAWIMFIVILGATCAVLASSKRWVHYHGD